jgi:hypothetical protein
MAAVAKGRGAGSAREVGPPRAEEASFYTSRGACAQGSRSDASLTSAATCLGQKPVQSSEPSRHQIGAARRTASRGRGCSAVGLRPGRQQAALSGAARAARWRWWWRGLRITQRPRQPAPLLLPRPPGHVGGGLRCQSTDQAGGSCIPCLPAARAVAYVAYVAYSPRAQPASWRLQRSAVAAPAGDLLCAAGMSCRGLISTTRDSSRHGRVPARARIARAFAQRPPPAGAAAPLRLLGRAPPAAALQHMLT